MADFGLLNFKIVKRTVTASKDWCQTCVARMFQTPGSTYNTGNAITLAGSILAVASGAGDQSLAEGLVNFFAGNLPATAASLGTLAFFYSGRQYDRAWINGSPPDKTLNDRGHLWSAIGASLIALSLVGLSATSFGMAAAIAGGVLHTAGKLGCLIDPKREDYYKFMPLYSRVPALAALALDLCDPTAGLILPTALVVSNVVWARADSMLLPDGPTKRLMSRILSIPSAKP